MGDSVVEKVVGNVEPDTSKVIMLFHDKGLNDVSTDITSKNN